MQWLPVRRLCSVAAFALAACGCGAGADEYANLNRDSATQQAMDGVAQEVNDPSSPLFHHRLQFVSIAQGHAASGEDAWRVRVADRTAHRVLCLDVWLKTDVVGTSPHTDAGYCGSSAPSAHRTASASASSARPEPNVTRRTPIRASSVRSTSGRARTFTGPSVRSTNSASSA
jgi:membrane-associated phospholipid phosphatase